MSSLDPRPKDESEQDVVKSENGPEHTAPSNPDYASSFDEAAGGSESIIGRERAADAEVEPEADSTRSDIHPVQGAKRR